MKDKLKRKAKYIFIGILVVALIATITVFFSNKKQEELKFEVNPMDLSGYTDLKDERHVFEEVDVNKILEMMESGTGFIYIGRESCEHCQTIVPILNKVAKSKEFSPIYYLNIEDYNSNETFHDEVNKIMDNLKYYFENGLEVPIALAIKDGHIVGFSSKLTNEKVYEEMIEAIQGTKESEFEEYFKPEISIKETYGELLTYVVGDSFDINKYIMVKSFKNSKTEAHFEVVNEEYEDYKTEGMHDIKIIVTDSFNASEIDAVLLTQKEEVIKKLTADNYKPNVSDYQKYVKENPDVEKIPSKGGTAVNSKPENIQGNNSSSNGVNDEKANSIVGNSAYYNYGCEAISGVYHGFSTPNDILDAGVYEVSNPQRGDIIAYFDANGNYVHTGTYLEDGMALQGNWSGGKAVITSASYATYRKYLRLGGSTEYGRYIYDTAHALGGTAGWLEQYYNIKDQIQYTPTPSPEPEPEPTPSEEISEEEFYDSMSSEERELAAACDAAGAGSEACQIWLDYHNSH